MGPTATPRLRVLSVGGNAISAFLSWRLQATNSCDVTLVWKQNYDNVAQYGITFKSKAFGNERFKPRHVVRTAEEAPSKEQSYDYVVLCVKALPDLYDLGDIIHSVVTPEHTCILVNTTSTLGVEAELENRFPTNVILSLVSGIDIVQTGPSEFEHMASSDIWVGPASRTATIPSAIQNDMATALSITLNTAQVNCKVSQNIRQEQFERMIGPIAFHPASVVFETANITQLLKKVGVRQLVSDVIHELMALAKALGCSFPEDYTETTIARMTSQPEAPSTMYQDFMARRPMEVETYLGSSIKLGIEHGVKTPRIETLYAMLHHINTVNQTRKAHEPTSPVAGHPPRLSSAPRPVMNNSRGGGGRSYSSPQGMAPPRRGPSAMGNHRPHNGHPPPRGPPGQREGSAEEHGLEEFSHVVLYEDPADDYQANGGHVGGHASGPPNGASLPADLALRERELMLRQRELKLREQELNMRRGGPNRRMSNRDAFDEDDGEYYDAPPPLPAIDPDNFDMMSMTSRKNRKAPANNPGQFRKNPEMASGRPPSAFSRAFNLGRNRTSARIVEEIPGMHDSLLDNPMMSYSSNRYGSVDRREMQAESRANSLTASRINELGQGVGHGPYPPPSRRTSTSPGQGFPPAGRGMSRASTGVDAFNGHPNGTGHPNRRSPPGMMRAPVPRPQGNGIMPQPVEQHVGVSNPYPAKPNPNIRSLTGNASVSAGSGDSGASANIDSEISAHSSLSSLPPRAAVQKPGGN